MFGSSSPFFQAYQFSDFLGKCIYLLLMLSSIICWSIFIYKTWFIVEAKKNSQKFQKTLNIRKDNLLTLEQKRNQKEKKPNPYFEIYLVLKRQTVDLLKKNHHMSGKKEGMTFLSSTDIDCIESSLVSTISTQIKDLEKYLFVLSTIVGLAPLMGLLGTVWGILNSFSQMQSQPLAAGNQVVLGGIALALTTTVLGLLTAIPALIAYNYLRSRISDFEIEMECFTNEILSSVEMRYRKVDVAG